MSLHPRMDVFITLRKSFFCAEFIWNEQVYLHSESYLDDEMEQVVDDFLLERLGPGYPL